MEQGRKPGVLLKKTEGEGISGSGGGEGVYVVEAFLRGVVSPVFLVFCFVSRFSRRDVQEARSVVFLSGLKWFCASRCVFFQVAGYCAHASSMLTSSR